MSRSVPPWPVVDLVLTPSGSATVNGRQITLASEENPRDRLLKEATAAAVALGRPLRVRAEDPSGTWHMIVDPGGAVTSVARPDPSARPWVPDAPRGAPRPGDVETTAAPVAVELVGSAEAEIAGVDASARAWYRTPQRATDVDPAQENDDESGSDPIDPVAAGLVTASPERREVPGGRAVPAGWQATPPREGARIRRLPLRAGFAVTAVAIALLVAAAVTSPQSTSTGPAASSAAATTASTSAGETEGSSAGGSDAGSPSSPAVRMVKAPPGYQTKPLWAWPVPGWTKVAVTDDGAILTRSAGGQLLKVDATTGAVMWSSTDRYGSDWDGPWLTSIDAQPVLALASSTTLAYWPLASMLSGSSGATPGTTTPGTLVPLPAGARVSWVGSSPLITSPPGAVGLIRGGVLERVNVPAGARALSTDGRDVLAVQGGRWLKVGAATQANAFRAPAGAAGAPVRVEAVSARFLLAVWPLVGKGQPIELIDAGTGAILLQGPLPAGIDITRGPVIRQVSGAMTAVGPVVVDTDNLRVNALERSYKPLALTKGRVYATSAVTGRPVDIHLSNNGTFAVVPFTADQTAVPFAAASTAGGRVALALVADDASGWLLTALSPDPSNAKGSTRLAAS